MLSGEHIVLWVLNEYMSEKKTIFEVNVEVLQMVVDIVSSPFPLFIL